MDPLDNYLDGPEHRRQGKRAWWIFIGAATVATITICHFLCLFLYMYTALNVNMKVAKTLLYLGLAFGFLEFFAMFAGFAVLILASLHFFNLKGHPKRKRLQVLMVLSIILGLFPLGYFVLMIGFAFLS